MNNEQYLQVIEENLKKNKEHGVIDNYSNLKYLIREIKESFEYALFINPGPNLENFLDEIKKFKESEDKVVLFCSDVCLPGLSSVGIQPDYVVSVDPNPKVLKYLKGHDFEYKLICPSFFPIWELNDSLSEVWVFNSVEENDLYRIPVDEKNEFLVESHEKSSRVKELLREYSLYGKYLDLLARGTVLVTMYQICTRLKMTSGFYGSLLVVEKDKPYADFISKANYEHICKIDKNFKSKIPSLQKYIDAIMLSYFNGDSSKMEKAFEEQGNRVETPRLSFYKTVLLEYSKVDELPKNKTVIFR